MAEADEAHALRLRQAREVGDRNADQAKDGVDVVQFQRIDDEMEPVRVLLRVFRLRYLRCNLKHICHDVSLSAGCCCLV
jgi:hypothetical protein